MRRKWNRINIKYFLEIIIVSKKIGFCESDSLDASPLIDKAFNVSLSEL